MEASSCRRECGECFVHPGGVGEGEGAEGFEAGLVLAVEEGAVEAEAAGLGGVDEAGGVVGAHLEEDAHAELADGLAAEGAVDVVEGVDAGDEMDADGRAFGDDLIELISGLGGVVSTEGEVLLVAELAELLQAVDEEVDGGLPCTAFITAALHLGVDFGDEVGGLVALGDAGAALGDLFKELKVRRA